MTPALREALDAALGMDAAALDALDLVVHVGGIGWSHTEPGLRLFVVSRGERVATVKRLAAPDPARRERILACYERFTGCRSFRPPRLLAWREDAHHLYCVESIAPGESLATRVAAGTLDPERASACLDAILAELWSLGRPPEEVTVAAGERWLLDASRQLFGDEPAAALVAAALHALRAGHPTALRTVLTTHDLHAGNVLLDGDGTATLVDFDLARETPFFGLDVARAWAQSAPLLPARAPAFLDADAYRLCSVLYPVFEYAVQAPLLPPPEREALRRYAQDLFVRVALPAYHADARHAAAPVLARPLHAQLFFADSVSSFSESQSLRFPYDPHTGRATLSTVIRTRQPLGAVRLDPVDVAHAVVSVHCFRVAGAAAGAPGLDAFQADAPPGAGFQLIGLLPVGVAPTTLYAPIDDPQIVVPVATVPPTAVDDDGDGACAYAVDVELEVLRDWALHPPYAGATLLGRLHGQLGALCEALDEERARGRAAAAQARAEARRTRAAMAAAAAPAAAPPAPVPLPQPLTAASLRAALAAAPRLAAAAAGVAARRLRQALRGPTGAAPAPAPPPVGIVPHVVAAAPWTAPHVSVVVRATRQPPAPAVADVLAWASTQTCASVEVVVWTEASGTACDAARPHTVWDAPTWAALRATLAGRFVALASADLLRQPPTYLESALLAMETEGLDCAITIGGDPSVAAARLAAGAAPGGSDEPLLRTIARPEALGEDLALDLGAALAARGATQAVVGKILLHTTSREDTAELPFEQPLGAARITVTDRHLVASADLDAPPAALPLPLALADLALPLPPVPSALPTVLMVMPFLAVGGAEHVALSVVRGLRDRVRFVVVTVEPSDPALGTTADAFRAETPYVYTAPDFLFPPLTFSLFAHLIRRFAPRTLYIANGAAWIYDAAPTLKAHYPALRIVDQLYDHRVGWIERYDAILESVVDGHIGCNRRIVEAMTARGVPAARNVYIPNGVDLDAYDPARYSAADRQALKARFGLPRDGRVVVFVARMHQQKRPMDFVELARQFAADPSITFLMTGDGPLASVVRAHAERLHLTNLVVRPFHRPSSECFAIADVSVLSSEYEGMPMSILEALAMGVPVAATDVGNVREVLERTASGRVVARVGDIGGLRHAVRELLDAPPDRAALRAAVAREFDLRTMVEAYYATLLAVP